MLAASLVLVSCSDSNDNTPTDNSSNPVVLANRSVTPALVKNVTSGVDVFSLLSSDDTLAQSPAFIFGGSADGMGLLKNADGTFTMVVNNEDNYSVSRITYDNTFKPVKGEYLLNSDDGRWRLCSATLATPEVHGFGPLFITCGEDASAAGGDPMIHAIDPRGNVHQSGIVNALGHWNAENAVPLPKDAYAGKTIVLIGDDDSGPYGGQVAMYMSNAVGDLNNGSMYVMVRDDQNTREMDMTTGQTYNVQFKKIDGAAGMTSAQLNTAAADLKSIVFGRVEDIDFRKGTGNGREIYFNVTGQNNTGVNADYSRTKYGRVYRLKLDQNDPTKGTLEVILNGDDRGGIARTFQDPDNVCVTTNYVYFMEDPNGYGDETHDAYLYQYDINAKTLKTIFELDHHRGDAKYNVGGDSKFGSWEISGMIDVSDAIGIPNTFAIAVQAHTWTGDRYKRADGGSIRPDEKQASQLLILKGLPR